MRRDPLTGGAARAAVLAGLLVAACAAGPATSDPAQASGSSEPVMILVSTASGSDRRFTPAVVSALPGADVRLVFRNGSGESHNLSFTGALEGIRTPTIMNPGQEETLRFVAPGPGTYAFVCTVHVGMAGELHVSGAGTGP